MGDFKTDLKKRDLLFSAFHERKNYRDNWISKIEAELEDQTLDGKAINKKMIGIEKWKNLHPVIERYSESVEEWGKFYFAELWKIVTGDRELADVVYNGILHLKGRIVQNREAEGLPILCADMSKLAYGRDSKDYQEWALLNELKDGLHEAFRQDQQQTSTAADQQGAEPVDCPADIQKKRRADLFIFFDECLRLANSDEKGFYQKGIPHRPKKGEKSQRDYLIPLCKKYHNTENIDGLLETFERKFRAYKADKLSG